jgi:hypothetical protein
VNLLFIYVGLVMVADVADYYIGLVVERVWGSNASFFVFLALYFLTLWVAWRLAVWFTEPKAVPAGHDAAGRLPGSPVGQS